MEQRSKRSRPAASPSVAVAPLPGLSTDTRSRVPKRGAEDDLEDQGQPNKRSRSTGPSYLLPDTGNHRLPKDQVKYGPGEGLGDEAMGRVHQHLYGASGPELKKSVVKERLTQYHPQHSTYVEAARAAGRGLTVQEAEAARTGENASNASINHVIASGVGQNTLNTGIAQFTQARRDFPGVPVAGEMDRPAVAKSLAGQAAAVGRQQMYSRAIAAEQVRDGEPLQGEALLEERRGLLTTTLDVMQGGDPATRLSSYRDLMKQTFDSPGNLRVGHARANGAVSTGFDTELDSRLQPTARSERLLEAHRAAAPDHDEQLFTTARETGERLSSSRTVDDD